MLCGNEDTRPISGINFTDNSITDAITVLFFDAGYK